MVRGLGGSETQVPRHGHVGTRFPEGRGVPRLPAVVQKIPGTSDSIVRLYMPAPAPWLTPLSRPLADPYAYAAAPPRPSPTLGVQLQTS